MDKPLSCSQIAAQRQEPLIGSAPRVNLWFLLTYPAAWGAKALRESQLPAAVKAHLEGLTASTPPARVLLIKNDLPGSAAQVNFFIAQSARAEPQLYAFKLDSYEALLSVDIPAFLENSAIYQDHLDPRPLFLVCTNGHRDPCCAQHGLPVYRALSNLAGERVWQCSHLGGHRFAANVLLLPEGIFYGGIRPQDAERVLWSWKQGQLLLDKLRGRATLDSPAQAAEYFLLAHREAGPWRLLESREIAADRWQCEFASQRDGERYRVEVRATTSRDQALISCRSDKPAPMTHYHLEALDEMVAP